MSRRSKLASVSVFLLFFGSLGTAHGVPPGWVEPETCSFECWFKGYVLTAYEVHPGGGSWGLILEPRDAMEYAGASRRAHLLSKYPKYARATLIKESVSSEDSYCDFQGHPITRGPVWKVSYPSPFEIVRGEGGAFAGICSEKKIGSVIAHYNWGRPLAEQAPPCPLGAGGCRQISVPKPEPYKETVVGSRGSLSPEYSNWKDVPAKELPSYFGELESATAGSGNDGEEDPKEPPSQAPRNSQVTAGKRFAVAGSREPQAQEKDAVPRAVKDGGDPRNSFCRSGKTVGVAPLHYPGASSCKEASSEAASAVTGFHFRNACAPELGGHVPERVRRVRVDRCRSADKIEGFDGGVVVEATVCCP